MTRLADEARTRGEIVLLTADYYNDIAEGLIQGAAGIVGEAGYRPKVIRVPGSFEIPQALSKLKGGVMGVIILGALIKGETDHYEFLMKYLTNALAHIIPSSTYPVTMALLTTHSKKDAEARSSGEKNKGREAGKAILHLLGTPSLY